MQYKKYSALLIDDHPLIAEAYKSAFKFIEHKNEAISFHILKATDCDSACEILKEYANNNDFLDIVFLDMHLPPSKDGTLLSGEDLGLKINELFPETKIIVSTTFNDNYRVHSILKNLNPEGFLVKNDLTPKQLVKAILEVIEDPPYYSKTVMKLLRNQISSDLLLDDIDRKILYEISIGTKTKNLSGIVHLSMPAIEKRKRQLRKIFALSSTDDRELILTAKDKGFI